MPDPLTVAQRSTPRAEAERLVTWQRDGGDKDGKPRWSIRAFGVGIGRTKDRNRGPALCYAVQRWLDDRDRDAQH